MKEKVTVKWSKKENDWIVKYPDRNGKILGSCFFDMFRLFEEFMSKNWEGKPTGFTNFRDYMKQGGFDPDTLKITVDKIPENDKL